MSCRPNSRITNTILQILALSSAMHGFANRELNFASELRQGNADLATVQVQKCFAYNPALLAEHEGVSFTPFFLEYGFNKEGLAVLGKVQTFERLNNLEKVATVQEILDKSLNLNVETGASFQWDRFGIALVGNSNLDTAIRGVRVPLVELDSTNRVRLFLSYAYPVSSHFNIGASIIPAYKLDHYLETTPLQILENGKMLNPLQYGKRGEAIGMDIGMSYSLPLTELQMLRFAAVAYDLGQTSYSNRLESKKYSPPAPDREEYKAGVTYEIKDLLAPVLSSVKVMYAYSHETTRYAEFVYPHDIGLSAQLWSYFILSLGSYDGRASYGLTAKYKAFEFSYANYFEVSTNISKIQPDRRQQLAIHLIF